MKKQIMICLALLFIFPIVCHAAGEVTVGRTAAVVDETLSETKQAEAIAVIVDEKTTKDAQRLTDLMTPLSLDVLQIDVIQLLSLLVEQIEEIIENANEEVLQNVSLQIYNISKQAKEFDKVTLSVQDSEKLKVVLRLIPSKQYPILNFPFLELTNDSSSIYWVDVSGHVNVVKMKEEIKNKDIKLAIFGVGKFMESSNNNFDLAAMKKKGLKIKDLPFYGKEFEVLENVFKSVRPDVPVARICVMHPNLQEWLDSFTTQPDAWVLFNVGSFKANFNKIKSRWFANRPVITNLNFEMVNAQKYGSTEYNEIISTLQTLGYAGNIFWR